MKDEVNIKITNAKQLVNILKDMRTRAFDARYYTSTGHKSLDGSIMTLIKVLEEAK